MHPLYNYEDMIFDDPEKIAAMMVKNFKLNSMAEEYAYLLALDAKHNPLGVFEVSHGTVSYSLMNPREILLRALLCGAVSIILVHNHPSQDCTPSKEDIKTTDRIKKASEIIGITLADHIIIGDGNFSFRIKGLL